MKSNLVADAFVGEKILVAQTCAEELRAPLELLAGAFGMGMGCHDAVAGADTDVGSDVGRRSYRGTVGGADVRHARLPPFL